MAEYIVLGIFREVCCVVKFKEEKLICSTLITGTVMLEQSGKYLSQEHNGDGSWITLCRVQIHNFFLFHDLSYTIPLVSLKCGI